MSQQPPGPYPGFPQYPGNAAGTPPKPPAPQTVLRAHYWILAGAVLSLVNIIATLAQSSSIRSKLQSSETNTTLSPSALNSLATVTIVATVVVGLIGTGMWIWMAFATKAGKPWARILSTVFFGVNAAGVVVGLVALAASSATSSSSTMFTSSGTTFGLIISVLEFIVGLVAIILLWSKNSAAYFRQPTAFYPGPGGPYGYPGMPPGPVPYTYPVMPQQPQGPVGPPPEPWDTPRGS
jgi:hypothetical protein